jgi:hypothetical protein
MLQTTKEGSECQGGRRRHRRKSAGRLGCRRPVQRRWRVRVTTRVEAETSHAIYPRRAVHALLTLPELV